MADKAVSFWRRMDWRVWSHAYIAQTPEMERVAFVRPCHLPKPGQPEPAAEERISAQIRDISLGGMVLVVNQRFDSGTLLKIEIPGPGGQAPLTWLARVIQVTAQSQRTFILSCCFAKELNEDDLRAFGAECVRPEKESDGRAWIRFTCDAETTFHSVVDAEQKRLKGKIVNISAGGFAMLADQRFEDGTLLSIDLAETEGQPNRPTMARVIHATERPEGGWVLGCTFVAELSDNDLQALM